MFLLRTAFWLAIIIMVMPTDAREQRQVYGAAKAAASDITHFCTRNPAVCRESKLAFDKFSEKAKFGGKLLMSFLRKEPAKAPTATSFFSPTKEAGTDNYADNSTNTLSSNDLKPLWGFGI